MIGRYLIDRCREVSRRKMPCKRSVLAITALIVIQLLMSVGLAVAQSSSPDSADIPQVPERLRYLFDLPWCKRWNLGCIDCVRKDDRIVCEKKSDTCGGFQEYYCKEFDVPDQCLAWSDGCNMCELIQCPPESDRCGSVSCTARGCINPKPRFACFKTRTWIPSSRDLLWPWNDGIQ